MKVDITYKQDDIDILTSKVIDMTLKPFGVKFYKGDGRSTDEEKKRFWDIHEGVRDEIKSFIKSKTGLQSNNREKK